MVLSFWQNVEKPLVFKGFLSDKKCFCVPWPWNCICRKCFKNQWFFHIFLLCKTVTSKNLGFPRGGTLRHICSAEPLKPMLSTCHGPNFQYNANSAIFEGDAAHNLLTHVHLPEIWQSPGSPAQISIILIEDIICTTIHSNAVPIDVICWVRSIPHSFEVTQCHLLPFIKSAIPKKSMALGSTFVYVLWTKVPLRSAIEKNLWHSARLLFMFCEQKCRKSRHCFFY